MKQNPGCSAQVFRRQRNRPRHQSGAAILELALVLPFLLLLVLGIGCFGRVFYTSILVNNAARAGAGYGIRFHYTDTPGMTAAAVADAHINLPSFTNANVTNASFFCACPAPEGQLASCYDSPGVVHQCAEVGYGQPQVYVRVDTQYTFNTFGLGADGNPVQVCLPGNLCLPASVTLQGHALARAQ